jgi:hypothetical protein
VSRTLIKLTVHTVGGSVGDKRVQEGVTDTRGVVTLNGKASHDKTSVGY